MFCLHPCAYVVTSPIYLLVAKIRRTESVPSDINNPVDRPPEAPQFGTLPKAITKKVYKKQKVQEFCITAQSITT